MAGVGGKEQGNSDLGEDNTVCFVGGSGCLGNGEVEGVEEA